MVSNQKSGRLLSPTSSFLRTAPDLKLDPTRRDNTSLITRRTGPGPTNSLDGNKIWMGTRSIWLLSFSLDESQWLFEKNYLERLGLQANHLPYKYMDAAADQSMTIIWNLIEGSYEKISSFVSKIQNEE